MIRVLFVCLGNICRSPMAEAVFAQLVQEAGLQDQIESDSAGTGSWHIGSPAHPGTQEILTRNGIPYEGRGRQISVDDLSAFDYIVTMDNRNLRDVQSLGKGTGRVAPLLSYVPDEEKATVPQEVPDPYIVGGFDEVFRMVNAGCRGLLATIRRDHGI